MKRIGFVIPWYGEDIKGGAETELRELVKHLRQKGVDLEVLTTCVRSFQDNWNENFHPAGETVEAGIPVRRFPVRARDTAKFDQVNLKLIQGQAPTAQEEEIFCQEMVNSPALYQYIREHGADYAAFVFIPYMFGTTYYGAQIYPEKTVLIPCLHDESYAYMDVFKQAYSRVRGMVFNAEPERRLAERLYRVSGDLFQTIGIGMDTSWTGDETRFRGKFGIHEPFMLYAGRKEAGKRVDMLVRYFQAYKQRNPSDLKLVLMGGGDLDLTGMTDVVDLGFVDTQDKYDAYAACEVFCNPSEMESFSIVLMEAWLAQRPVMVNAKCEVTKDFVNQAQAGLYFDDYFEFEAALNYLRSHRKLAEQMGINGREFVLSHFAWDVITRKYCDYFGRLQA